MKELDDSNPVSRDLLLPAGNAVPLDSVKRTPGYVPTWFQTSAGVGEKRRSLLSGAFKAEFPEYDGARIFLNQFDVAGQLTGRDPLNQALYLWSKSILPNYVLTILGDRMEMAHSIEGRVPFLDHHVIECLRRVPVSLKIRGMTEKHILREATRPVITDTVYRRQKHPFLSPPVTTLPGDLGGSIRRYSVLRGVLKMQPRTT